MIKNTILLQQNAARLDLFEMGLVDMIIGYSQKYDTPIPLLFSVFDFDTDMIILIVKKSSTAHLKYWFMGRCQKLREVLKINYRITEMYHGMNVVFNITFLWGIDENARGLGIGFLFFLVWFYLQNLVTITIVERGGDYWNDCNSSGGSWAV